MANKIWLYKCGFSLKRSFLFDYTKLLKIFLGLLCVSFTVGAEVNNVGELSNLQQRSLMLKATLEQAQLEKALNELNYSKELTNEVCHQQGIGSLSLLAVYGINKQRFATFSYNHLTQIDAGVGDRLLCGEKVRMINIDKVEIEKAGKFYTVSGAVTAIPNVPLKPTSPNIFR